MAGILSGSGTKNCGEKDIYNYWIRVSEHLPWIKCVQKNANENKTTRDVERACHKFIKKFYRRCETEKDEDGNNKKDESGKDILIQDTCQQCERIGWGEEVCVKEE